MKKVLLLARLFVVAGALAAFTGCDPAPQQVQQRIIHNNDGTDALFNKWFQERPLSKADVEAYVDMVAGSQVTTFMMCTGSDFLYYRSKYGRVFGDDGNGRYGCDDTTMLRVFKQYYQNVLNLEAEGTDVIEASLLRAQQQGMEAFITYRMNDLHFADKSLEEGCPIQCSDFWLEHPEYRLGDATQGWHSAGAFDFAIPEVRQRKLDILTEQLEKYEMLDGMDLDFMRFVVYFKSGEGPQNAHLLTDLVKKVRAKVDSISAVRGKKILLSVRVPQTLEGCTMKGIDIQEWVRLGLVDFISIGVHWKGETAIPVAKFIRESGIKGIPVYGSIDDGGYTPRETFSHGALRGMASHILSQGADGLYLFNFYFGDLDAAGGKIKLEPGGQVCRIREPALLREMGSLETLRGRNKIYCESDGVTDAYGLLQVGTLPLAASNCRLTTGSVYIGDDVAADKPQESILFVRTDRPARFVLTVNGTKVSEQKPDYPALYDRCRGITGNEQVYAFVVPEGVLHQGANQIGFVARNRLSDASPDIFVVRRLEIALKYGDVETHGYF